MVKLEVRKNTYYDSVTLMIISKDVKNLPGITEALVGMGTDLNREIAGNLGLDTDGFEEVTANDFFVAAKCDDEDCFKKAVEKVDELLNKKAEKSKAEYFPPTLDGAIKVEKALNMAVISVPGRFAADVAKDCLDRDINVMLFSDNVTIEEEKALKEYAVSKELLMMGPDCGTAVINHVPLAFANVIKPGKIGLVCASGTGAQEVSTIIDQLGEGVSQLLGTGGRDLKAEIGGIMMKQCLNALIEDPKTEIIVLVSKPPAKEVEDQILKIAAEAGKPVIVCFIGGDNEKIKKAGLYAAVSLEDAAHKAVALAKGEEITDFEEFSMGKDQAEKLAAEERAGMIQGQKYVRGLYTGGTICDEAMKLLIGSMKHIYSNIPLSPEDKLENARNGHSKENTFLDFGDDEFTVGRPHPMIDSSLRAERVVEEAKDPETAVILVDCVIGYGSHEDPAKDLSDAIRKAKDLAAKEGRYLSVVATVCGTEGDPQSRTATSLQLTGAGAIVLPSNAQAASGKITFDSCHHHNAVGPMAGIITYSMPVWHVVNKTFGNDAYCTMNEGLGKVLRFGACDEEVFDRLRKMEKVYYPVLKEALEIHGEIDMKVMIAQALQMGDEGHNRNKAGTSLFIREILADVYKTHFPLEQQQEAIGFINGNDHAFLNLSMPSCKATMDPTLGIPYSTIVSTMCRNGVEFGIRISGLGADQWFTAPSEYIRGLYFPGYSEADANPDIGDSCITETTGIGGFCMAASPAIVQFVGGQVQDAINYSSQMYEITEVEGNAYKIPVLDFRGSATGIDIVKVLETGIRPIINTGIAHKDYGVGQIGAGLVNPPEGCFTKAIEACAKAWEQ